MKPPAEFDECGLAGLSTLQPDAVRSVHTRQRCRAALQGRARIADHPVASRPSGSRGPRPPASRELAFRKALAGAVGILCVVYVLALIAITVSLQ